MNSVGIDLHRKRSFIAVIDEEGQLAFSGRIVNDRETFLELLGGLEGESRIAVEATYGWEWLSCSRTPATRCTWRTPSGRGRSPRQE